MRKLKEKKLNKEYPSLKFETKAIQLGFSSISGVDEAGRGPIAGPVVAAAVILRDTDFSEEINDSKKLSEKKRLAAYDEILDKAIVGVAKADNKFIDSVNILQATIVVMEKAVEQLQQKPDYLLVDGNISLNRNKYNVEGIIKGDQKSLSIACASIVAKVTRDAIMDKYHNLYPEYNLAKNKGYPTKEHITALYRYGITPIHRRSFRPVSELAKLLFP